MNGLIERLQAGDPGRRRGRGLHQGPGQAGRRARGEEPRRHPPARVARQEPGVRRVAPVHGGVQTFPILHGKPVSAEQFDVLDESTKRALTRERGEAHQGGREGGAASCARRAPASKPRGKRPSRRPPPAVIAPGDEGRGGASSRRWATRSSRGSSACARRWPRTGTISSSSTMTTRAAAAREGRRRARRSRARDAPQSLQGERAGHARAGVAGAGHLRHEPDVPEPVRVPRAAGALRRAAHRLHAHPRGLAAQGQRRRARRAGGRSADRSDHLGAHEARASRAAHRRRGSARAARPLRDDAAARARADPGARRARRPARRSTRRCSRPIPTSRRSSA